MKKLISLLKRTVFLSLIFTLIAFASCRSNKDLSYLRDIEGQKNHLSALQSAPAYKIEAKDNLYISIVSSNAELNKIYNPAQAGNSQAIGTQLYEGLASQYINGYEVDAQGYVTLPLIGKINVLGKTINEAEINIQERAGEFFKEVTAKVRLLNYKITVMGEVENPGVYYNYNYEFTIFDAISMANGITDYANLEKVKVLRPGKDGNIAYEINLNSQSAIASEVYFLQPNDVVFVQPAKYKNVQFRTPIYLAFLTTVSTFLLLLNYYK